MEKVKYGETVITPGGVSRKRSNEILRADVDGAEQVVGRYEERLTPRNEQETQADRQKRLTANRGQKRSAIPLRKKQKKLQN